MAATGGVPQPSGTSPEPERRGQFVFSSPNKSEQAVTASVLTHPPEKKKENNPDVPKQIHFVRICLWYWEITIMGTVYRMEAVLDEIPVPWFCPFGSWVTGSSVDWNTTTRPLWFSLLQECATCVTHHPPDDKWSMFTVSQREGRHVSPEVCRFKMNTIPSELKS